MYRQILTNEDQFPKSDAGNSIFTGKTTNKTLFQVSPKILLVEDNQMIQMVNSGMLNFFGCEVDIAEDGYEAISMYSQGYDLIFIDIGLPKLNGIETTRLIRSQEIKRNIIIAITAYGDCVEKECQEVGVDDFYTKPILIDELTYILTYWLPHLVVPNNSSLN